MLLMMHAFTRENRCGHCKKMKPVTRRRYDFGSPRVSLRVIKFQKRTSVSPSGMQMIFITQIMNHESIESIELGNVCLKDWDKLMKEFEGSSNILVADVDCIGSGKSK